MISKFTAPGFGVIHVGGGGHLTGRDCLGRRLSFCDDVAGTGAVTPLALLRGGNAGAERFLLLRFGRIGILEKTNNIISV